MFYVDIEGICVTNTRNPGIPSHLDFNKGHSLLVLRNGRMTGDSLVGVLVER